MRIGSGKVLCAGSEEPLWRDVVIENGVIADLPCPGTGEAEYDARGYTVIPGLIDTHIHGSMGAEFASGSENLDGVRSWLCSRGVTAVAATVRAMEPERMAQAAEHLGAESRRPVSGAKIAGIHLEGPFVCEAYRGAMTPPPVEKDKRPEVLERLLDACSPLPVILTVAPEYEGGKDLIRLAVRRGAAVSLGHTGATCAQMWEAMEAGATRVTHLFNAMRGIHHREAGAAGYALLCDRLNAEVICDGVHLSAEAISLALRLKGCDGLTLVSDSGAMSGLGDGEFIVGGRRRIVKDGVCRNEEGKIAGSCVGVLEGARNLLAMGVPLGEISIMASRNPARALGLRTGEIRRGYAADLLITDERLHIRAVFVDGVLVWEGNPSCD